MKLFRAVLYTLPLNEKGATAENLKSILQNLRYPEFLHVERVDTTDIGEWSDDHELNKRGADYSKYFPQFLPNDSELGSKIVSELNRLQYEVVRLRDNEESILRENYRLKEENDKLAKFKEFLKKAQQYL